ncbi:MAG: hypothetical protein SFY56_03870 [Bacteroidota bacterium]|nr:hypothetical protein [Bacteroidota bacterium]
MRIKLFIIVFLLIVFNCKIYPQKTETTKMLLNGIYSEKNLLVKNTFRSGGIGFSIVQININGQISPAELTQEIVEVPLDLLKKEGLKIGDSLHIEIFYKTAFQKPSIINPGAFISTQNKSNFNENSLIIEGEFNWGIIYIINPLNSANKTRSIKSIKINGRPTNMEYNKEIVSLNLSSFGQNITFNSAEEEKTAKEKGGFKEGEKIQIEFVYEKGFDPIILNPELITPWPVKQ